MESKAPEDKSNKNQKENPKENPKEGAKEGAPKGNQGQKSSESKYLSDTLNALKNGDDMDIMTILIELSQHLLLSNDTIADNPTMIQIIEEVCKNLEKTYIPELITYTLQCINNILDINPTFTSTLKKINAIPKIIILMSAIEDLTFLEYIIKILEKISYENSFILLENNTFVSLLNYIDFLGENQRISVMKTCLNMGMISSSFQYFISYIQPALPVLSTLTRYNENDMQTTNLAILIFYNLIAHCKANSYIKQNPGVEKELMTYGLFENLSEIIQNYLLNPNNKKIGTDLIKRILKIFQMMCSISSVALDKLVEKNIIQLIVDLIKNEFEVSESDKKDVPSSGNDSSKIQVSFLTETLQLLISFFPSGDKKEKILSDKNQKEYHALCENIISPLVKNIMIKSACSTLNNVVKFLIIFSESARKDDIIKYMDPKALAQIISKLLDTKHLPYVDDIISLLKIIMEKVPEYYVVPFIREGVVEGLRNFKVEKKKEAKPKDSKDNKNAESEQKKTKNEEAPNGGSKKKEAKATNKKEEVISTNKKEETISTSKKEKAKDTNKKEEVISTSTDKKEETISTSKKEEVINTNKKEETTSKDNPSSKLSENRPKEEISMSILSNNSNNTVDIKEESVSENEEIEDEMNDNYKYNEEIMEEIFENDDELAEQNEPPSTNNETSLESSEKKFKEIIKQFQNTTKNIQSLLSGDPNQKKSSQFFMQNSLNDTRKIEAKLKELNSTYFTEEKINSLLSSLTLAQKSQINLKKKLIELKTALEAQTEKDKLKGTLKEITDILSDKTNEITLFELESSGILLSLCSFFEKNFIPLYNILSEDDMLTKTKINTAIQSNLIQVNEQIFSKVKTFISCFNGNKAKIENFISLLQYTITSMNCFTMLIEEGSTNNLYLLYNQISKDTKKFEIRVFYTEEIFLQSDLDAIDDSMKSKLNEYNNAFLQNKEIRILITSKTTFGDIMSILLSNTGVSFSTNQPFEVILVFRIEVPNKNKEKKEKEFVNIDLAWTQKDMTKELLKKFTSSEIGLSIGNAFSSFPIQFGVSYRKKEEKKEVKENKKEEENQNPHPLLEIKFDKASGDIEENNFEKIYHFNLMFNQNLYEIKRLMPSLFILSLLYYPIMKYEDLFEINKNLFTKKEKQNLFINPKVTLLIDRACRDGYSVSKAQIPSWCFNLSLDFNFLSKFNSRYLLFKVSFDPKRSLLNLQNYLKSTDNNFNSGEQAITVGKSMRLKISIKRDEVIDYAMKLPSDPITSKFIGYLEFEYENEVGIGIGPTLEFYSLVIDKLKNDSTLWYKTTDLSLYPRLSHNEDLALAKNKFVLLGFVVGRALYDDRLIDVPLSKIFWDVILEREVTLESLQVIDKDLGKTLIDLSELSRKKKELKPEDLSKADELILYNGQKLSSLDLYFTFPGTEIPLKEKGDETLLTMNNVEEYINLIYDKVFREGISYAIASFKSGFNLNFGVETMKIFTSEEIENNICGSLEVKWEKDVLSENIKAEHGVGKKSRVFGDLITFMCSLNKEEQRQFLLFVTGTPRLPVGGFKALRPKLTVVNRSCNEFENPDNFLPTVMTCQNYLKIPDYSSYEILREKLFLAMNEGNNEFHLS